jgi:hypothetical protein
MLFPTCHFAGDLVSLLDGGERRVGVGVGGAVNAAEDAVNENKSVFVGQVLVEELDFPAHAEAAAGVQVVVVAVVIGVALLLDVLVRRRLLLLDRPHFGSGHFFQRRAESQRARCVMLRLRLLHSEYLQQQTTSLCIRR